jgi:hypothetical protein
MFTLLSAISNARRWRANLTYRDYMLLLSSGSNLVDLPRSVHCDIASGPTRDVHGIEASLGFSINCDNVKHTVFSTWFLLSHKKTYQTCIDVRCRQAGPYFLMVGLQKALITRVNKFIFCL